MRPVGREYLIAELNDKNLVIAELLDELRQRDMKLAELLKDQEEENTSEE